MWECATSCALYYHKDSLTPAPFDPLPNSGLLRQLSLLRTNSSRSSFTSWRIAL